MNTILDNPRTALMVLSSIVEPGDADLDDLIGDIGPVEAVTTLWTGQAPGRLARLARAAVAMIPDPAERAATLQKATGACGARVIIPGDLEWPTHVAHLARLCEPDHPYQRPPLCLWVRGEGDLAAMSARSVAVVGARAASEYGKHVANGFAADLAQAGYTVVAGGAFGIDRAAHLGALGRGGPTVAVLPSGVDQLYPQANTAMFDLILRRGLVVSEWPPGVAPTRHRFLARMRLIAAVTAGIVVVEASRRSGVLAAARYATGLGRTVMFTPGPVTSSVSEGVHLIARENRGARLVTRAEEVIEDLTDSADRSRPQPPVPTPFEALTAVEQRLIEALPRGYLVDDDRLATAAGVPVAAAAEVLHRLRRLGWVEHIDGRWRLRAITTT